MHKLKYFFLIFLAALLIGGCFLQHFFIIDLTEDLTAILSDFSHAIDLRDFDSAETALAFFYDRWTPQREKLFALTDHSFIISIDTELSALHADLRIRNTSQLYSQTARLSQALQSLARPEQLSLSNIF